MRGLTTHCAQGHEYSEENTGVLTRVNRPPCRKCKTCALAAAERRRLRKGEAVGHPVYARNNEAKKIADFDARVEENIRRQFSGRATNRRT